MLESVTDLPEWVPVLLLLEQVVNRPLDQGIVHGQHFVRRRQLTEGISGQTQIGCWSPIEAKAAGGDGLHLEIEQPLIAQLDQPFGFGLPIRFVAPGCLEIVENQQVGVVHTTALFKATDGCMQQPAESTKQLAARIGVKLQG